MKKNYLYVIFVIILLSVSVYSYFSRNGTTLKYADFAVKEPSSITKIKLSNKDDTLLLELIDKNWKINGVFEAQQTTANRLLRAISLLKVKAPVIKINISNITQQLFEQGIKVNLFKDSKLVKSYYVSENVISGATYMMMSNVENPFIVEIPGYSGSIASLYSLNPIAWRNNRIFSFKPDQIESIQVKHFKNVQASFTLERIKNEFVLKNNIGEIVNDVNKDACIQYLAYFYATKCKKWVEEDKQVILDSLINVKPENILKVKDLKGNEITIRTYFIPVKRFIDEYENEIFRDLDCMYVSINENDLVIVNNLEFDLLLKEILYFMN